MSNESPAPILLSRSDDDVVTLTLNRPDVRNAMTADLTDEFTRAVEDLRSDENLRALIITGAGSSFCAGGDLSFIKPGPGANVGDIRSKMRAFYGKFLAVRSLDVPTIAAINGAAIGAGMCLALACDLRVAAQDAKISLGFTRLGLHPGMAGTYLLTRLVGTARAADLMFTSRTIDGNEALSLGLVNRAVPREALLAEVRTLASSIAENAPLATRMVKRAIHLAERADLDTMLEYEGLAQPITMATNDLLEGLDAVKEKRVPKFSGR
ncbi:MAG: crotonase/enoyl-CoA hydratase family protein [Actinomycetota bacterium]